MFQHYVSRFYLKNWQTEVNSVPKRIWVYRKGEAPRHGAIKNVAGEEDFYAIEDRGSSPDNLSVEYFLRESENKTAPVFQKIRNEEALTDANRSLLAEFLTIFWQRSPYQKAKTKTILEDIMPKNFSFFRKQVESLPSAIKVKNEEELNELEKWHSENPTSLFPKLIKIDSVVMGLIESMDWVFTKSPGKEFLTSDNAFIYSHGTGLGNAEHGHFLFPLGKYITLQATHFSRYNDSFVEIEEGLVNDINLRTIRNAFQEVYASYESAELAAIVNKEIGRDLS